MFQQILFIELLGGIGDLVIALPAIQALAKSHPTAHLSVLTFAPSSELLHHDPLIHQVFCAEPGAAKDAVQQLLQQQKFDLIVSDTSYEGISELIQQSFAQQTITNLWRSPPPNERVSDRFLRILAAEGVITPEVLAETLVDQQPRIQVTPTEKAIARQALAASYRPIVVLCPEAGMPIKQWSVANFVELGQLLQQQYGATILVPVGSQVERAEQIVQGIGSTARLWQRGTLRQLAAAIAKADLVIAADTGLAHIAAALTIPTITLFGPAWYERYGQAAPHINLQGFSECPERKIENFTEQSCWYSNDCPFVGQTCMDDISVSKVLQAASQLLAPSIPQAIDLLRNRIEAHAVRALQSYFATTLISEVRSPSISVSPPLSDPNAVGLDPAWRTTQNVLVMRLDNLGDVIMTSPALRTLRENLPQARITLMTSPAGHLIAPLFPWVDEVLPWRVLWQDLGKLNFDPDREWNLIQTLSDRQFDAAIIFTSFSQSPHPAALICALAGIPLRLAESKEQDDRTLTHPVSPTPEILHQVDRNLHLLESLGFSIVDRHLSLEIPQSVHQAVHKTITKLIRSTIHAASSDYILLNPWTTCQSRNYDAERFAIAARQLSELTGLPIVITGLEKDRNRSSDLLQILGQYAIDQIGQTTFPELAALVADASLVLTNNTSTMHLADATNTPMVILFAGTELESQWRPRRSRSIVLRRPTVCSPCYAFQCPYQLQCLDISPEAVVRAGLDLLQQTLPKEIRSRGTLSKGR